MSARKPDSLDDDEDHVLWQRVTALVKPAPQQNRRFTGTNHYNKNNQSDGLTAAKFSSKRQKALPKSELAGVVATPAMPNTMPKASPVDLRAGDTAGLDGSTQKRLFRGDVTIDARLDLHGFNVVQAQCKLTQFLGQARLSGNRCLLVITGKGARGEGVLRSSVPEWLKSPPLSDLVLAIAQAKLRDGGAGALYVLLRRQRDQK
jgi:DNA-nicking Smr family endonuclease